jgi:hypothetical protein
MRITILFEIVCLALLVTGTHFRHTQASPRLHHASLVWGSAISNGEMA